MRRLWVLVLLLPGCSVSVTVEHRLNTDAGQFVNKIELKR